jgi:predicted metalloendopeptidase
MKTSRRSTRESPLPALAASGVPAGSRTTQYGIWGVDLSGMDQSIRPGEDFYLYANGTWLKTVVLPESEVGNFADLRILNETRLQSIAASIDAKAIDQLIDEERKLCDPNTDAL